MFKKTTINPCPICNHQIDVLTIELSAKQFLWRFDCSNCSFTANSDKRRKIDAIKRWNNYTNDYIVNEAKRIDDICIFNDAIKLAATNNYNGFQEGPHPQIFINDYFVFLSNGKAYHPSSLTVYMLKDKSFSKSFSNIDSFSPDDENLLLIFNCEGIYAENEFTVEGVIKEKLKEIFNDVLVYYVEKDKEKRLEKLVKQEKEKEEIAEKERQAALEKEIKVKEFEKILEGNFNGGN